EIGKKRHESPIKRMSGDCERKPGGLAIRLHLTVKWTVCQRDRAMKRVLLRLYNAIRPGQAEGDLTREIASHLALLEDDFRRRGLPVDEARLAARRTLGGAMHTKDLHRDARSFIWLDDFVRDARYAIRTL